MLVLRLVEPLPREIPQMSQQNHDQVAMHPSPKSAPPHLLRVALRHTSGRSSTTIDMAAPSLPAPSSLGCTTTPPSTPSDHLPFVSRSHATYLTSIPPILIRIPPKLRMPIPTLPRPHHARHVPSPQPSQIPRHEPIPPVRAMSQYQRFLQQRGEVFWKRVGGRGDVHLIEFGKGGVGVKGRGVEEWRGEEVGG